MAGKDWRETDLGAAARAEVLTYFLDCLRMLDAGMEEQARSHLRPFRWREKLDLRAAPFELVMQTERLCATGRLGDYAELEARIAEIIGLW